jgi:Zn finger protein HypA/HybF involved in hydrogenase expression
VKGVHVLDEIQRTGVGGADVAFLRAGDEARGAFQCADCGYGVSVQTTLPRCPMCSGRSWALVQRHAAADAARRASPR